MNKFVDWLYRGFQTTEQMKCGNIITETKECFRSIKMLYLGIHMSIKEFVRTTNKIIECAVIGDSGRTHECLVFERYG